MLTETKTKPARQLYREFLEGCARGNNLWEAERARVLLYRLEVKERRRARAARQGAMR